MKELQGTEKQIKWAEDIRKNWNDELALVVRTTQVLIGIRVQYKKHYDFILESVVELKNKLNDVESASKIISMREKEANSMLYTTMRVKDENIADFVTSSLQYDMNNVRYGSMEAYNYTN
jgi:hypothetical protein